MGSPLTLRRAADDDAAAMARVAEVAYTPYLERMDGVRPRPLDTDYRAAVTDTEAWVAETDDQVVGLLLLVREEDGMLLENVAVLPSRHGRGVGRALLELAEQRTRAHRLGRIRLYTHVTMVENQRLYERIGYVETVRETLDERTRVFYEKQLE